jgi:hypothetical protein
VGSQKIPQQSHFTQNLKKKNLVKGHYVRHSLHVHIFQIKFLKLIIISIHRYTYNTITAKTKTKIKTKLFKYCLIWNTLHALISFYLLQKYNITPFFVVWISRALSHGGSMTPITENVLTVIWKGSKKPSLNWTFYWPLKGPPLCSERKECRDPANGAQTSACGMKQVVQWWKCCTHSN